MKLLTETVNSIINNIPNLSRVVDSAKSLTINGKELVIDKKEGGIKSIIYNEEIEEVTELEFEEIIIYTILEATLKSIELGHYSCTGYLIKLLIDYDKISSAFKVSAKSEVMRHTQN